MNPVQNPVYYTGLRLTRLLHQLLLYKLHGKILAALLQAQCINVGPAKVISQEASKVSPEGQFGHVVYSQILPACFLIL